jgi:hypothetical protein
VFPVDTRQIVEEKVIEATVVRVSDTRGQWDVPFRLIIVEDEAGELHTFCRGSSDPTGQVALTDRGDRVRVGLLRYDNGDVRYEGFENLDTPKLK